MPEFNPVLIPSRSRTPAVVLSVVAVVAIMAAVCWGVFHRMAVLTVPRAQVYAAHTELSAVRSQPHVMGMAAHANDDLYVVATVKLANQAGAPLIVDDETATLTAADGSITQASAVDRRDLDNLFVSFPDLKAMAGTILPRETQVAAGQSAEGSVILYFPGAKQTDWNARKSATVTLDLYHRSPVTATVP